LGGGKKNKFTADTFNNAYIRSVTVLKHRFSMRGMLAAAAILIALAGSAMPAGAAELVMFRSAGCPYCAAWDRAIGPIYPKTDIGKRAPLRQVDIGQTSEVKIALVSPIRFTPTFVLVDSGRELGRIEGYPGEDFFWGLLERLLLQHRS
jgi:thioredoxin-related protein